MQQRIFFLITLLMVNMTLYAQFADQFSDGDFSANPTWEGETSEFVVNAEGWLQLNGPDAGTSLLGIGTHYPYASFWEIDTRLEFSPSTTNYLRIYLYSKELSNTSDAYYLEIGENGSTDALRLLRRSSGSVTTLGAGVSGAVGTDTVGVHIEVSRTATGVWTVWMSQQNGPLIQQFSVTDTVLPVQGMGWFGLYCNYSLTRKDKFYFDNIRLKADSSDMMPPQLVSSSVVDGQTLRLVFNEPLDSLSAVQTNLYALSTGIAPASVVWTSAQPEQVVLKFTNSFSNGQQYTLTATGVRDWLGNTAAALQTDFSYLQLEPAAEFDIVVNEIMAKPSPTQGLPESAEWVELLNRSAKYIRLSQLTIADGTGTPKALPDLVLAPDSVVVIGSAAAMAALAPFTSKTAIVSSFPSLNDDGDKVILATQQGMVIDKVSYSSDWHSDAGKRLGGWSLERRNPDLYCLGSSNWQSCPNVPGGSPGKTNFSNSMEPDSGAPGPFEVNVPNAQTLVLTFTEGMEPAALTEPDNYLFTPALDILQVTPDPDNRAIVTLNLSAPMQVRTVYEVRFLPTMTDCAGNSVDSDSKFVFGVPEIPERNDILINELLFNPATGGSRFVEFYNNSDKIFTWKNLYITNTKESGANIPFSTERLLIPGDFFVFSLNRADIISRFDSVREGRVITQILPSMDDKFGNITLFWAAGGVVTVIDSLDYSTDLHNPLLSVGDQEGVSIERIRYDLSTHTSHNWTSASNNGSPTRPNSQIMGDLLPSDDILTLSPARISPDFDGFEDYLDIIWNLETAGNAASITIFDSQGIPVRKILRQQITGTQGALRWDGDDEQGSKVRPGIYILYLEIFNAEGQVIRVKKPFAVVSRF